MKLKPNIQTVNVDGVDYLVKLGGDVVSITHPLWRRPKHVPDYLFQANPLDIIRNLLKGTSF